MKFFIFFIFSFLFACDTSSIRNAYNDYYLNQQLYVSALIKDNKKQQVKSLKELIKCGKYLELDTSTYEKNLKKLTKKKISSSKKVIIYSFKPLAIQIGEKKVKFFQFKTNSYYKKVFDIYNAYIEKPIFKKLNSKIYLKAAQYNQKIVRIVLYSTHNFKISKSIKNQILLIKIPNKKTLNNLDYNLYANINKNYKKIIVIDPGHGGKDPGGIGVYGIKEKNVVLKIGKYLYKELKKAGFKVYMTRNRDLFVKLKDRTHFAKTKHADLFISIHCNIAPKHLSYVYGIETYFLSPARTEKAMRVAKYENKEIGNLTSLDQLVILKFLNKDKIISSNKLGIDVQKNILAYLRSKYDYIKDNGVRPAPFWVLVGTQMPAILIETGYLTNKMEALRLNNPNYQKLIAKGIAEGIKEYFKKNP